MTAAEQRTESTAGALHAAAIAGSPAPTSSSGRLAERVLQILRARGCVIDSVYLAALPADALLGRVKDGRVEEALALVERADILIVATPVYRATYTALLKALFDLMPADFLVGKTCVLIATGAAAGHLLAIDHGLRPLIASLGGISIATTIYATREDFVDDRADPELDARLMRAATEATRVARAATE